MSARNRTLTMREKSYNEEPPYTWMVLAVMMLMIGALAVRALAAVAQRSPRRRQRRQRKRRPPPPPWLTRTLSRPIGTYSCAILRTRRQRSPQATFSTTPGDTPKQYRSISRRSRSTPATPT